MHVSLRSLNDKFVMEALSDDGNKVVFDATPNIGGMGAGIRPMEGVLMSLAACSSIDVRLILQKQQQVIDTYTVEVDAQRADAVPAVFTEIQLHFILTGSLDSEKVKRAVQLSMEKYCSVSKMLEHTVRILSKISLNGTEIQ